MRQIRTLVSRRPEIRIEGVALVTRRAAIGGVPSAGHESPSTLKSSPSSPVRSCRGIQLAAGPFRVVGPAGKNRRAFLPAEPGMAGRVRGGGMTLIVMTVWAMLEGMRRPA